MNQSNPRDRLHFLRRTLLLLAWRYWRTARAAGVERRDIHILDCPRVQDTLERIERLKERLYGDDRTP